MDNAFWQKVWDEKGFASKKEANEKLQRYFTLLDLSPSDTVLVPLCGKTIDMLWLAQQDVQVFGVELCKDACLQFFKEQGLRYRVKQKEGFTVYQCRNIEILCGDFFSFSQRSERKFSAVYDNAALSALPDVMRQQYISGNCWFM